MTSPLATIGLALLLTSSVKADLRIYEGFDYAAGAIDGSMQNGGLGLAGAWTASSTDAGILFSMVDGALNLEGLTAEGTVRAKRPSAPRGGEMQRAISTAAQTALTADNSTIWFSVLVQNERFSISNENFSFVLGSGAFDVNSPDKVLPTITDGDGFGVHLNGNTGDSTIDIFGYQIVGGVASQSATKIDNDTSINTFMIAGRIDWAPDGSDDTLTLYNIADPAAALPEAFATMTADFDQTEFGTLAIASRQVTSIDEIRFGDTAADVGLGGSGLPRFALTEIEHDPVADSVTLTWTKTTAAAYIARYSIDMSNWEADLDDEITADRDDRPGDAGHITVTFPLTFGLENEPDLFFRIEEKE